MNRPTLVVMAAGMGSRYGGLKQIDPVGPHGEIIIDYSLYDAMEAGFDRVVFIINRLIEEDFHQIIGRRAEHHLEVCYAYQELDSELPPGFSVPSERTKPWGTAHALLCCQDLVNSPFAAINADDYYGKHAFSVLYDHLQSIQDSEQNDWSMVGYFAANTLTEYGSVARGICETDENGRLVNIVERLKVYQTSEGPAYSEDDGKSFVTIPHENYVSMNFFGFTPALFAELKERFPAFLEETIVENPLKGEFLVPQEVGRLLQRQKATMTVLSSPDRWYGVTYREDKPAVIAALSTMSHQGLYPDSILLP